MMSGFEHHRKSDRVIATFSGFEADLLRSLASQMVELLRNERAEPAPDQPHHAERQRRPHPAADDRVERDPPLEQPRDLQVGRAEHMHHLDRAPVNVEPAPHREGHHRERRRRQYPDQGCGEPGEQRHEAADGRHPCRVPVDARGRRGAGDRGGDGGGGILTGQVDID